MPTPSSDRAWWTTPPHPPIDTADDHDCPSTLLLADDTPASVATAFQATCHLLRAMPHSPDRGGPPAYGTRASRGPSPAPRSSSRPAAGRRYDALILCVRAALPSTFNLSLQHPVNPHPVPSPAFLCLTVVSAVRMSGVDTPLSPASATARAGSIATGAGVPYLLDAARPRSRPRNPLSHAHHPVRLYDAWPAPDYTDLTTSPPPAPWGEGAYDLGPPPASSNPRPHYEQRTRPRRTSCSPGSILTSNGWFSFTGPGP
jgi:hypothetical protein